MDKLPFEITEGIIQCFGKCFHLKDLVASFMVAAGVPKPLVNKYRPEYKFVWARRVLEELDETENGRLIQRKILTNLCKLTNLPDPNVVDRHAGLDALRTLKSTAVALNLLIVEEKEKAASKREIMETKQKLIEERASKLEGLRKMFGQYISHPDRQAVGYALEDLLKELFFLFDIDYRKSYKTQTQQIDGYFRFEGFDYIVEAKWRKDTPNEQEIAGFKQKVDTKIESTRGLFVAVQGFNERVINQYCGRGANIIFVSGQDLYLILDGRFHLHDALRLKIEKAAQEGEVYFPLPLL